MRARPSVLALFVAASAALVAAAHAGPPDATPLALATASTHPMKYWLSAPQGPAPAGGWPVLVVITDATRQFQATAEAFAAARHADKVAIVVPATLGSGGQAQRVRQAFPYDSTAWARAEKDGNCAFDDDGIGAVLADVRRTAHTAERATLTGLEAAGHVIFAEAFRHPERWRAVYAVTPNYRERCLDGVEFSRDPSRESLPIVILHGERDTVWTTYFIAGQAEAAHAAARVRGFGNWRDRAIPARGHEFMPDVVFEAMRADTVR